MKRLQSEFSSNGGAGHNSSSIEEVAVRDLIIDQAHPWKHKAEDVDRAMQFVTRYGADHVTPVMIDFESNVVIGAAFVEAAKKAGVERLRVVRQAFANATDRKLFSVAGAKILSTGFWDGDALAKVEIGRAHV